MDLKDELKLETYKRLGELGMLALRTVFLLNGGAAIALLAFLGNAATPGKDVLKAAAISHMAGSMNQFVIGIAFAAFATVLTYIMQLRLFREYMDGTRAYHPIFLWSAIACVLLSIGAFIYGAHIASSAFT